MTRARRSRGGARRAVGEGVRGVVERDLRVGDPGAPRQLGAHGLVVGVVGLLGEIADVRGGGGDRDAPGVGWAYTGKDAHERRLAGAVGADEADHVTGRDDEVEAGEQVAFTVAGGDPAGLDGRAHALIMPSRVGACVTGFPAARMPHASDAVPDIHGTAPQRG